MRDDIKAAVRSLRSSPTFTAVALIVLALGIGAASALYSVADAVVLRGLPFDEHDRMMAVIETETTVKSMFGGGSITPQTYLDWREQQQSFDGLTAVSNMTFRIKSASGEPADARGQRVTHEFFPVFRAAPILGRTLNSDDEIDGQHRRAVISHGFWQRQFGGDPGVIGRTIDLNEEPWEIVGVLPRDFAYPVGAVRPSDLYVPAVFRPDDRVRGNSRNYNWTAIGRLKSGVSRAQAQDQMWRVSEEIDLKHPKWGPGRRARVLTLHDHIVGRVREWMLMLMGAVALLLVIACANVANLMLARATARAREVGIRAALGAGRWRVVRGLLVEGIVLALVGAAIGVLIAYGGVQLLKSWLPANLPRVADIAVDLRVLSATIAAGLATGMLFAIVPALHAARADVVTVLKEGGRSSTAGGPGHRLRNLLVVAEVAIAVILLVGAGLFGGSFIQLIRISPGFDYSNLLTLSVSVRVAPASGAAATTAAFDEARKRGRPYIDSMIAAVSRAPGVQAVGIVQEGIPLSGSWSRTGITVPGRAALEGPDGQIDRQTVTPNYLQVMSIPLLRGRHLSADDHEQAQPVAILSEAAAKLYFPDTDAVGQRIVVNKRERLVVGVSGDVRSLGPENPVRQTMYMPYMQETSFAANLVMKTAGDPMDVLPAVKAAIWSVNPEQRLTQDIVTVAGYMDRQIAQRRFNMALLVLFGGLGLLITAAGIYGVMAYIVEQRTSEIGVRMALGATPGKVLSMVITRAAVLMIIGIAIGAVAAWQLSASVRSFLFQMQSNDVRVFAVAVIVLAVAGLVASAVPARRAARVDPLIALRTE